MIYCNHVGAEVGASSLLLIFFFYLNFHTFFHHVLHVVNILFRYILKTFVEISNFHKFFFLGGGMVWGWSVCRKEGVVCTPLDTVLSKVTCM